jgi:ribosome-binding protein aMBF1 (putative translation factor)
MVIRRIHRNIQRTPDEQARIEAVRDHYQQHRPTPDELLASGDVDEFVPLGEYLGLMSAVRALRKERELRGLSLATIAERSGIDKAALSRLENGLQTNPTVDTLYRYAAAVGVELVWSVRAENKLQ